MAPVSTPQAPSMTARRAVAGRPVDFSVLAQDLMFGSRFHIGHAGLALRKGKTREDVLAAMRKARDPKNGHAKTELELSMLEVYLKDVFRAHHVAPYESDPPQASAS